MSSSAQPDPAALRRLLRAVDPELTIVQAEALAGGVSAHVTRIDAMRPDGSADRLVLRQYGAANLSSDPRSASHECKLLALLHAAGLPVPRPRYADESRAIVPVPCLVIDFVDAAAVTSPADVTGERTAFTGQLAAALASIHRSGVARSDLPHLSDVVGLATTKIGTWPASLDEALDEAAIRAALARAWPPPQLNAPVLLHGDYWPGNTLWRDGALVCVIDWEDALFGDPLADVANARMELTMAFSTAAAGDFTLQYAELMPSVDLTTLPHWDVYAALRHQGRMSGWGLSAAQRASLTAGHREFTAAALARFPFAGASIQNDLVADNAGRLAPVTDTSRRRSAEDPRKDSSAL